MFALLLTLLAPSADACGLAGKSHVVGFDASGKTVLLRLERENDQGGVHEITLAAFDLAAKKQLRSWPILTPEDEGDKNKRGARWKAAEKEILAMGIEVMPEVPPFPAQDNERYGRGWQLTGANAFLTLDRDTFDEGMMQRFSLTAHQGDTAWTLGVAHEGSNGGCGGFYPEAWRSPSGQYLLLLDQNFLSLTPHVVSAQELSL